MRESGWWGLCVTGLTTALGAWGGSWLALRARLRLLRSSLRSACGMVQRCSSACAWHPPAHVTHGRGRQRPARMQQQWTWRHSHGQGMVVSLHRPAPTGGHLKPVAGMQRRQTHTAHSTGPQDSWRRRTRPIPGRPAPGRLWRPGWWAGPPGGPLSRAAPGCWPPAWSPPQLAGALEPPAQARQAPAWGGAAWAATAGSPAAPQGRGPAGLALCRSRQGGMAES